MTVKTTVIRPGLLVSLKSTVSGGVSYSRVDLPAGSEDAVSNVSRWETTKVTADPDEHTRATKARSSAVKAIRKVCAETSFGLLCPESSEADLEAAVALARSIAADFNKDAAHSRVDVYVLTGRIASSDAEAARAIGREVADLITSMNKAIDDLDPKAIRAAANRARDMSAMLSPELSNKVGEAVDAARKAARTITQRVEKNGEDSAVVLAAIQRGNIEAARFAFLDLDDGEVVAAEPALPAIAVQRFAALDEDEDEAAPVVVPAAAPRATPETEEYDEVA
jgi:hypothetical protein